MISVIGKIKRGGGSMNRVCLIGRLTADADIRKTDASTMCMFTVAISESKDKTSFISVVAFGNVAEAIAEYTRKGSLVAVEGALRQRVYETSDGAKRSVTDVVCSSIDFLSKKPEEAEEQPKDKKGLINIEGDSFLPLPDKEVIM